MVECVKSCLQVMGEWNAMEIRGSELQGRFKGGLQPP